MAKKKDDKVTWKETFALNGRAMKVWYQMFPKLFTSIAVSKVFSAAMPYIGIYLSAQIITELTGNRDPKRLLVLVLIAVFGTALMMLGNALLTRWKNAEMSTTWDSDCRIYAKKFSEMDFPDIDAPYTHQLRSRIGQNTNINGFGMPRIIYITDQLTDAIIKIALSITLSVGLFVKQVPQSGGGLTVLNHPVFILLLLMSMLLIIWLRPYFDNKAYGYFSGMSDRMRMFNRHFFYLSELADNKKRSADVRLYRQDRLALGFYDREATAIMNDYIRSAFGKIGCSMGMSGILSGVLTGMVYLFVCLKAYGGAFGIGEVTQYISAVTSLAYGVTILLTALDSFRQNTVFLRTTFEFLDIPNKMYQGSLTTEKRSDRKYTVEFCNVSFKYPNAKDYALRNVSMKFEVGKRMAVVGKNGSGKTTFIKLLCRLYDPDEGQILLNGIDIRKYRYDDYMKLFSVVFQDFNLFAFSLADNVAAGEKIDRDKVTDCLMKAGFGERLSTLEQGIDTPIYKKLDENGVEISGGEAQKIAIARALYKDAPFIILDEPTAALDPITEAEIYEKFDGIVGDKTAVYISHRLSSCRFCDEILVFDAGSIVQKGSHDTLVLDQSGLYYALWNAQAQYYTKEA